MDEKELLTDEQLNNEELIEDEPISDEIIDAEIVDDEVIEENENDQEYDMYAHLSRKERSKMIKKEKKKAKRAIKVRKKIMNRANQSKYEQGEDIDFKDTSFKGKITFKRVLLTLLAILLIVLIVLFVLNRDMMTMDNFSNFVKYGLFNSDPEERYPIDIQGSTVNSGNFSRMGQYLVYTSDTMFSINNNYGKSTYNSLVGYTTPVISPSKENCIIYGLGDKGFEINSKEEQIYKGEMENNILVADVNDNGDYAIVTEFDGYLSKLFVYTKENKQIYAYSFADYYVTSCSINSNGHRIMLSGISALEGAEITSLYVLDVTEETPVFFHEFENNLLYKVSFLNDNEGCAIGSTASYGFKIKQDEVIENEYEGKTLTSFDINKDSRVYTLSLSKSGDGRNCEVMTFNSYGETIGDVETQLSIKSLTSYGSRFAALSDSNIYLYSRSGNLITNKNAGLDAKAIVLYSSKDAYILGVSSISRIDL